MKIELSKTQYKELLKLVMIGTEVKTTALEAMGESAEGVDALQRYLFSQVEQFELDELVRLAGTEKLPSEKLLHEIDHILHDYDDDTFWFSLETELGQRDFYESLTFQEHRALKEGNDPLPEEVNDFYEKYSEEFERHGADRLRVVTEKVKRPA
jgi:hypothetical protein